MREREVAGVHVPDGNALNGCDASVALMASAFALAQKDAILNLEIFCRLRLLAGSAG